MRRIIVDMNHIYDIKDLMIFKGIDNPEQCSIAVINMINDLSQTPIYGLN